MSKVPTAWGLYRIHKSNGAWYVGISSNLRARLQTHARSRRLDFAAGDVAEFILAKQGTSDLVVTWHDLQLAERDHIQRLKDAGVALVNQVAGGNGLPPATRFALNDVARRAALPLQENRAPRAWWERSWQSLPDRTPTPKINLGLSVADVNGDWKLYVEARPRMRFVAHADGGGPWQLDGKLNRHMDFSQVAERYERQSRGRDLATDLTELFAQYDEHPEGGITEGDIPTTFWWPAVGRAQDDGGKGIVSASLRSYTAEDLRSGRVPKQLADQGLRIDPTFTKGDNLNKTIRLVNADGARIYAKTEENYRANRAELLASLIWFQLGWRGVTQRSVLSEDGSVLIMGPIGGAGVEDQGSFEERFTPRSADDRENKQTIKADRAGNLVRVTLERLGLADDLDVVRFLVTNAAWGNSDRHSGNVHYGWLEAPDSIAGGFGVLLPIDHGRCFFNNHPRRRSQSVIERSPADAVTGEVSNPHQLLRPFAQLVDRDRDSVVEEVRAWCEALDRVVGGVHDDPTWSLFRAELADMRRRVASIKGAAEGFVAEVERVVVR